MSHKTLLITLLLIMIGGSLQVSASTPEMQSIIIEVDGDPAEHQIYLEKHYPFIKVIATYDVLFNGLALQADPEKMAEISALEFIRAIHPVQTYQAEIEPITIDVGEQSIISDQSNLANFTGKGIKVGVIDTGIDYNHPDLAANYMGGYDLVDLDDDPMETTAMEGMPTLHGTHVAGIIAANGKMKGVAPDAEIYAYRALGPGGSGSSIQVIAAMERALEDGVQIMNLSLGNDVNGPDYPTSIAVNRAVELGVAVVIANGNNGPNNWTVGSPATASKAISVGASESSKMLPYLYEAKANQTIELAVMQGSQQWIKDKDYQIIDMDNEEKDLTGKIALIQRSKTPFYQKAKMAEDKGAIAVVIYNNEKGKFQGSIDNAENPIKIPVASISKDDGMLLAKRLQTESIYLDTKYKQTKKGIASFSSRGPVTINWQIKPDILAPGTNILSTIPGGYQELQGTSMAAPYVTGAIALLKEAHPSWRNDQIIGALKTTALQMQAEKGQPYEPISQGMGEIQIEKALNTSTIIMNPLLTYGKVNAYQETKTVDLTIENTTNKTQRYYFSIPKQQKGLIWMLPKTFTIAGNTRKTMPVELRITTQQLKNELHQGWLTLNQNNTAYHLPYLFINKTADYPKAMGFEFSLKTFSEEMYQYSLYVTEQAESVEVNLYNPDTMVYEQPLLRLTELEVGMNEGEIDKSKIGVQGYYKALITIQLADGKYESHEADVLIE